MLENLMVGRYLHSKIGLLHAMIRTPAVDP